VGRSDCAVVNKSGDGGSSLAGNVAGEYPGVIGSVAYVKIIGVVAKQGLPVIEKVARKGKSMRTIRHNNAFSTTRFAYDDRRSNRCVECILR
jgi:hypothetical protein